MKLSKLNIRKINFENVDRDYPGQDILMKLGELYQFESGIYAQGNIIKKLERKIEEIITNELDKIDCIEVKFPILQPKDLWLKSNRWNDFTKYKDTMYTLKNNLGEYGLAPTAEECATMFSAARLISEKNLPAVYYQINEKFRKEIRTRGYLLRTRSFKMLDAYSFDKDEASLKITYSKLKEAYINIFNRIGIKVVPIIADNGSFGGNISEEWMCLSKVGEDTILYNGSVGLNKEVLEKNNYMEYLKKEYKLSNISDMKEYKSIELGHTFQLGTKYSEEMNLLFTNSNNENVPYYMGCYGIGIERIIATILENNVLIDNKKIKGFSLPYNIAPYKVQIIYKEDKEQSAFDLYEALQNKGIEAIIDDRKGYSLGNKIKDVYALGTPYIIVIGDKFDGKTIEIENAKSRSIELVNIENIIDYFEILL